MLTAPGAAKELIIKLEKSEQSEWRFTFEMTLNPIVVEIPDPSISNKLARMGRIVPL
jgi:hypothetical protein